MSGDLFRGSLKPLIADALFSQDRSKSFESLREARRETHEFLRKSLKQDDETGQRLAFMRVTGIDLTEDAVSLGIPLKSSGMPSFEVHSVQPALRVTPSGQILKQLLITVTQRIKGVPIHENPDQAPGTFDFRGGSTLIFDMEGTEPTLRYAITRPIRDPQRLDSIRAYRRSRQIEGMSLRNIYFDGVAEQRSDEPFCFLHDEH